MAIYSILCLGVVVYCSSLALYRLYFHPLSRFPGPSLAAVTLWYDVYFDIVKRGKFLAEIERMHEKYGPIVRINPHELHISDPEYYGEIYGSAKHVRDKYQPWTAGGALTSVIATVGHEHHRLRRAALSPFYTKSSVRASEPIIREHVKVLTTRLQEASQTGKVIRIDAAFIALSLDVIYKYCFAEDMKLLLAEDFALEWRNALMTSAELAKVFKHLPLLKRAMPKAMLVKWLGPLLDWKSQCREFAERVINEFESKKDGEQTEHKTIFHTILESDLPAEEKTLDRLSDEGQILMGAAAETTGTSLTKTIFHLLRIENQAKLQRLKKELKSVMPKPESTPSCLVLEQLPYLCAVVSEGLRLQHGATTRIPRVARGEVMKYKDREIPVGTPISSTPYIILMNPTLFPHPGAFLPERWLLENGEFDRGLEKYMVGWGKGPRQCIGMSLAYTEIFFAVAMIIRRFEMRLYETDFDDVKVVHDFFMGYPKLNSKGVRIIVTGEVNE
ncbi:Cytochrome P450 monooxygenase [Lachnellula occidentalis]|uniref:Cytochrome P450 monooxygenase n=1 Tax=Lachnellula occidentalis TaxID=215460 RepID=A0A8H8RYQ5_9HELO|nr:Cytochrome P450 monooxygenase [Lachnellula occidentalis]